MIDRRYFSYYDWLSFFLILVLSAVGLITILSATYTPSVPFSIYCKKQFLGTIAGLFLYLMCCCIDYRSFERWGYFIYFLVIVLLGVTLVKGHLTMGGQRWINLGIFGLKFQPSELAKVFFAPFFSYYLVTEKSQPYTFKTFVPIIAVLGVSTILILKQPDLGTAIVALMSGITLLWLVGIGKKFLVGCLFVAVILAPCGWKVLKPYQKRRIAVFFGEGDRRKERYQIEQSEIAVGSGGIVGKGFLRGTQNKFQFLPQGRNDFIFSVLCEEWGFLGALLILFLYAALYYRLFFLIAKLKNFNVQILATGLIVPLIFSTLINIGMVLGLLPVVGIPLPFMTYGISHLWMSFISLGFVQSIFMRRFTMLA